MAGTAALQFKERGNAAMKGKPRLVSMAQQPKPATSRRFSCRAASPNSEPVHCSRAATVLPAAHNAPTAHQHRQAAELYTQGIEALTDADDDRLKVVLYSNRESGWLRTLCARVR